MSTLLSAQSLHVDTAFGPLFNDLSFTLKKGDRIGLIGYNGCGKSTLLQVLDGTLTPNSGSVSRANHCLLARVEQHLPDALLSQPLLQVVLEKLAPGERDLLRWQAERLLAEMGFTVQQTQQQAATLSGGQHTRLLLARALINNPICCCWMSQATISICRPCCGWKASCKPGRGASWWCRTITSYWML